MIQLINNLRLSEILFSLQWKNTDVILKNYTRNNIGLSDGDPQTKNFNE